MFIAAGNGNHIVQTSRDSALPEVVVTPGHDGAVILERQTVTDAGGNRLDIGQIGWDIDLPNPVQAPGDDCAIALERQAMSVA